MTILEYLVSKNERTRKVMLEILQAFELRIRTTNRAPFFTLVNRQGEEVL